MTARSEKRWRRFNRAYFDEALSLPHPKAHPSVEQPAARLPTRAQVRCWMLRHHEDFIDGCGELEATQLVEAYAANHPEVDHWLDDSTHWIWDLPIQIAALLGLSY